MPCRFAQSSFLLALLTFAAVAMAEAPPDGLTVMPGKASDDTPIATGTFTLKNGTGTAFKSVSIDCALLDENGVPKSTGSQTLHNVASGATVFGSANFYSVKEAGGRVTCRVEGVQP